MKNIITAEGRVLPLTDDKPSMTGDVPSLTDCTESSFKIGRR